MSALSVVTRAHACTRFIITFRGDKHVKFPNQSCTLPHATGDLIASQIASLVTSGANEDL
jgi:hypothetical protein